MAISFFNLAQRYTKICHFHAGPTRKTASTCGKHILPSIFHVHSTYIPRIFHVTSTYIPHIFHVTSTYHPRVIPRNFHVQAGLQPACILLRVCNPRQTIVRNVLRRRNAAPPNVAPLVPFPGRRPGHRRRRVANPPQRGSLRGRYVEACVGVSLYVLHASYVSSTCLPRTFHVPSTYIPRASHVHSTCLPCSDQFATHLHPVAGLAPRARMKRPPGVAPRRPCFCVSML